MMQHTEQRFRQPVERKEPSLAARPRRRPRLWRVVGITLPLVAMTFGCSIAPRNFRGMTHPAAITRARSVGLGNGLPESQVVPTLIRELNDPDPVVRLSAHEELRRRSGQDFGYLPWAPPEERAKSITQWQAWWEHRRAGLARLPHKP
ncbi:hypothetical protein V5E97_39555 [Singulisphaera sp. Ch08]|uniref:HEAT repeat domain-containing protein n=1 Tax=Singulisphaera sp. Ch08 TaxID=3120278 RepID=A0AAU7CGP3_9BACT